MSDSNDQRVKQMIAIQKQKEYINQMAEAETLGRLKQVMGEGISFSIRPAHARATNELPETICISKFSQTENKVFYHLHYTHRGGGIGGLLTILQQAQEAIMRLVGAMAEEGEIQPGKEGMPSPPPEKTGKDS